MIIGPRSMSQASGYLRVALLTTDLGRFSLGSAEHIALIFYLLISLGQLAIEPLAHEYNLRRSRLTHGAP